MQNLTTKHRNQHDESIERSLQHAGIGRRYWRASLADSPHLDAKRVLEWVMGESRIGAVTGWTFVGGNEEQDLAIMTARALHVTGRAVRVYSMLRFVELLTGDRDWLEENLSKVGTLLLMQASPVTVRGVLRDDTFTGRELRQTERRLEEWLVDGQRLLLHVNEPLDMSWFSPDFLQRVADLNQMIGDVP